MRLGSNKVDSLVTFISPTSNRSLSREQRLCSIKSFHNVSSGLEDHKENL